MQVKVELTRSGMVARLPLQYGHFHSLVFDSTHPLSKHVPLQVGTHEVESAFVVGFAFVPPHMEEQAQRYRGLRQEMARKRQMAANPLAGERMRHAAGRGITATSDAMRPLREELQAEGAILLP